MSRRKTAPDSINIPNILPICRRAQWRLHHTPCPIHFAVAVTPLALGPLQQRATASGQRRVPGGGCGSAGLAAEGVEVLKVALGYLSDVLAAEDADLEVLCSARGQLGAAGLEVGEVLVDDLVGADVPGNIEAVALMGDELAGGGKVDAAMGTWSAGRQIGRETERQTDQKPRWVIEGTGRLTRCEDV